MFITWIGRYSTDILELKADAVGIYAEYIKEVCRYKLKYFVLIVFTYDNREILRGM